MQGGAKKQQAVTAEDGGVGDGVAWPSRGCGAAVRVLRPRAPRVVNCGNRKEMTRRVAAHTDTHSHQARLRMLSLAFSLL